MSRPTPMAPDHLERLRDTIDHLRRVPDWSREGFLRIGESMGDFSGAFATAATQASAIRERLASGHGLGLAPLQADLKKIQSEMTRYLKESEELAIQLGELSTNLEGLVQWGYHLEQEAFLPPISLQLRKGGGEDVEMQTLSSILDNLMQQARPLIQEVLHACQGPLDGIRHLSRRIRAEQEQSSLGVVSSRKRAQGSLERIHTAVARIEEACRRVEERASAVARTVFQLIASLQYDDITAQRIEHAVVILERVEKRLTGHPTVADRRWSSAALRIVLDQLEETFADFDAALQSIRHHLTDVADQARDQSAEVGQVREICRQFREECSDLGFHLGELPDLPLLGEHLPSDLSRGLTQAEGGLFQAERSLRILAMTSDRLGKLSDSMIRKDSHHRFEVLLSSIQDLTVRINRELPERIDKLDESSRNLLRLGEVHGEKLTPRRMRINGHLRRIPFALQTINGQNDNVLASMNDTLASAQGAFIQIMILMSEMTFQQSVRRAVERAVEQLGQLSLALTNGGQALTPADLAAIAREFEDLQDLYTMEKERQAHLQSLGLSGQETANGGAEDDGFELF